MGDKLVGSFPHGNPDNSLNLIQMAMQIHGYAFHTRMQPARAFLQNEDEEQRFLAIGGRYMAAAPSLADGQAAVLRFDAAGRLIVAATVIATLTSPTWTQRYYKEITVTAVDQTVTFGFDADQVIVANDDTANAVYIDYSDPAIADVNHDKILAGEAFTDQFKDGNIHLICGAGLTALVRVWARAE